MLQRSTVAAARTRPTFMQDWWAQIQKRLWFIVSRDQEFMNPYDSGINTADADMLRRTPSRRADREFDPKYHQRGYHGITAPLYQANFTRSEFRYYINKQVEQQDTEGRGRLLIKPGQTIGPVVTERNKASLPGSNLRHPLDFGTHTAVYNGVSQAEADAPKDVQQNMSTYTWEEYHAKFSDLIRQAEREAANLDHAFGDVDPERERLWSEKVDYEYHLRLADAVRKRAVIRDEMTDGPAWSNDQPPPVSADYPVTFAIEGQTEWAVPPNKYAQP